MVRPLRCSDYGCMAPGLVWSFLICMRLVGILTWSCARVYEGGAEENAEDEQLGYGALLGRPLVDH
eukprot:3022926-Pyramimonas_sp.AAC.1